MKNKKEESGITLIALVITVVIIAITAAVSISTLGGDEGIVNTAFEARENYIELNDSQQIDQLTESIIKEYQISGQNINLSDIAQKMNEQDWIKSATVDGDILITTTNGYVYQFYYNEQYRQRFVEYLGREDENEIPDLTATYNNQTQNITVSSTAAQRIELMYNDYDEIVKTVNGTSLNYTAQNTGWYIAKTISSNGKIRYAWIRASIQNIGINLEVTSVGIKENGWYGKDNVPVDVRISTDASEIYYRLETDDNFTHVENNITTITSITQSGKIYAYAVDSSGRESEISSINIKYDDTKPIIGEIVIEGDQEDDVYTSDIVISLSNMSDNGSGIDGYFYWTIDENAKKGVFIYGDRSLTVKSEGTKTIAFQAKDKAGNLSDIKIITVTKESE